jgi:glutamate/tyrosine decarboxylase-like PLP-dependent enzyme
MGRQADLFERMAQAESAILDRAAHHALAYLTSLPERRISPSLGVDALRRLLGGPLPAEPCDEPFVIDQLVNHVEGGLLASSGPRFFGWVIGGALPVAIAADWLTAAWDQNAAAYALSPAAAVVEEVCGAWLKELLGLPSQASYAFVTGCQMAHTTALAAARHHLLAERGIDVETAGLAGAPPLRLLTGSHRHESIIRSVRLLGLGTNAIRLLPCDQDGSLRIEALAAALEEGARQPTIVCLQAGDLNTGAFDRFGSACALAHASRAWVHVDGAFGLWAAASPRFAHLVQGVEQADSWATDGHKWLNLPFDSGFVFVADPRAHRAAFGQATSYSILVEGSRRQIEWNPEWSRRARGFAVYATIRALGQSGIAAMIERCCDAAATLADGIRQMPGAEILAPITINQALARFGDSDERTDAVIEAVQQSGVAWFGGTTWHGKRVMRISVCNWRTSQDDVALTLEAIRRALA